MERASNGSPNHRQGTRERSKVHRVGIHSYRGGSGRTTLAANLAYLAARAGARVAVMDLDLQAPALHIVLGVEEKRILHSVSEFVQGQCEMKEVPIDLSRELEVDEPGSLHLLPASPDLQTITSILFEGYDVARLNEQVQEIAVELDLDLLIQDTHLGVNRETLLSLATSDTVLVLLRPDGQDHQGAFVLVQMAKKVGVPDCLLVPNMITIPRKSNPADVAAKIEKELCAPVAGLLPWCGELPDFGCQRGLFAARYPGHPFTAELERACQRILPAEARAGGRA